MAPRLTRPILTVTTVEIDGEPSYWFPTVFDKPELLAMASEGFCPFTYHKGAEPEDRLFKVEPQKDGTVICPGPKRRRMTWEWDEEIVP